MLLIDDCLLDYSDFVARYSLGVSAGTLCAIRAVVRRTRASSSSEYIRKPPGDRSGRSSPYRCSQARSSSGETPVRRDSSPMRIIASMALTLHNLDISCTNI